MSGLRTVTSVILSAALLLSACGKGGSGGSSSSSSSGGSSSGSGTSAASSVYGVPAAEALTVRRQNIWYSRGHNLRKHWPHLVG